MMWLIHEQPNFSSAQASMTVDFSAIARNSDSEFSTCSPRARLSPLRRIQIQYSAYKRSTILLRITVLND